MIALLDSNIWYSALISGGNERVLVRRLLAEGHTIAITDLIRDEVTGVIRRKLAGEQRHSAENFFRTLLDTSPFFLKSQELYARHIVTASEYINTKDAPILAAGLQDEVEAIVSGDNGFIKNEKLSFLRKKKIFTTRELLEHL
jgi:predicted nucleic acid-binding protein